jgi:hypothetical protein
MGLAHGFSNGFPGSLPSSRRGIVLRCAETAERATDGIVRAVGAAAGSSSNLPCSGGAPSSPRPAVRQFGAQEISSSTSSLGTFGFDIHTQRVAPAAPGQPETVPNHRGEQNAAANQNQSLMSIGAPHAHR